jgi:creatinine amidohydrolase
MHPIPVTGTDWAAKTRTDVTEIGGCDGSVAVVPVGSVEQHGHHLPVGTDTLLAGAVTDGAVDRADAAGVPVLSLPPLWTGHSPHHESFGGTVSLGVETLIRVLEDVADSVLANGFDALLLVNGHGGNSSVVDTAVSSIGAENGGVEVAAVTYFHLADGFVDGIRDTDVGGMGHGGEFETSLMLHLFPDLVREGGEGTPMDDPAEQASSGMFASGPLTVYREYEEYSSTGAVGAPEAATAEKGRRLFESLSDDVADIVVGMHERTQ